MLLFGEAFLLGERFGHIGRPVAHRLEFRFQFVPFLLELLVLPFHVLALLLQLRFELGVSGRLLTEFRPQLFLFQACLFLFRANLILFRSDPFLLGLGLFLFSACLFALAEPLLAAICQVARHRAEAMADFVEEALEIRITGTDFAQRVADDIPAGSRLRQCYGHMFSTATKRVFQSTARKRRDDQSVSGRTAQHPSSRYVCFKKPRFGRSP